MVEHIVCGADGPRPRIVVLSAGEKIADGPPAAVAADPNVVDVYSAATWAPRGCLTSVSSRRLR